DPGDADVCDRGAQFLDKAGIADRDDRHAPFRLDADLLQARAMAVVFIGHASPPTTRGVRRAEIVRSRSAPSSAALTGHSREGTARVASDRLSPLRAMSSRPPCE